MISYLIFFSFYYLIARPVDCSRSKKLCLNGGICKDRLNVDPNDYTAFECACSFGWTGPRCEQSEKNLIQKHSNLNKF